MRRRGLIHNTSVRTLFGESSKEVASGSGWDDHNGPDPEEVRRLWDEWLVNEWGPQQPVPIANATWADFERARARASRETPNSRELLARENRQLRLRSGWDWLSTEVSDEDLIGSGWLSTEDLPRGVDDRGLSVDEELAAAAVKLEDDVQQDVSVQRENVDDEQWDPVEINLWLDDYIDFCEVVRGCASRRDILGQPVAYCTRMRPCVRCRYHVGAALPHPQYWMDILDDEIDEFILLRVAQRMRRDKAIERSGVRRRHWPATVSPRSRSPTLGEGGLLHLPHAFSADTIRLRRCDVTAPPSPVASEPPSAAPSPPASPSLSSWESSSVCRLCAARRSDADPVRLG